jgi:DNA-binding NarL/FixJ family response regulator
MAQEGPAGDRIAVWTVEDDAFFRNTLVTILDGHEGMYCEHAFATCEEALAILESDHAPEVMLMDIVLPGMNGIDGAMRVREVSPSTRIVMLTSYDDDDRIFRAICAGASGYLLKTGTREQILGAIEDVLRGGSPLNAQIARKIIDRFAVTVAAKDAYGLTKREKDILQLAVEGLSRQQIADRLFLSFYTIQTHLKNIYAKLQVHTCQGAVSKALKEHLL